MSIFQTGKNTFAIGSIGKTAKYVVKQSGKKITGVRGVRPILAKGRFPLAKANKAITAALTAAVA